MRLARRTKINTAPARLIKNNNTTIALIGRFDRPTKNGRLMYNSAATMLGTEPGDHGEHAYTEIVDALRQHGASPNADIEELWRRIAFSILITNVDDHLLNHGFLHVERGLWRLTPTFNINPFPKHLRELKTWISKDTGPEATIETLMSVLPYFRISAAKARAILIEVETTLANWRTEGANVDITKTELDDFTNAFEHAEREAARHEIEKRN